MPYVYAAVCGLHDQDLVDGGHCVALVKHYPPGPHRHSGQHAALFIASAGSGIWITDQWKGDSNKPKVSKRHIPRRGQRSDGTYPDASNNAEAFYVIER